MRPVADDGAICELTKLSGTTRDLHHRKIRVAFDPGFLYSQSGIPLKELSVQDQWSRSSASQLAVLTPRIKLLVS